VSQHVALDSLTGGPFGDTHFGIAGRGGVPLINQTVIVAATLALATAALPPGSNGLGYIWCPMDCLSDDVALPVGSGPSILLPMSDLVATFPELMERKTRGSSLSWTEAISLREPSPKLRLVLELFAAQRRIFDAQTLPLLKEIGRRLPHLTPNEAIGHQQFCPNPSILDNFNCILHADYPPPTSSTTNDILSTPATVMLDSLLDSVGVVAMMVDTLPVTIMPALYAELVRAAGGTRALYGPYLAVMVDFIRKVVGLGVRWSPWEGPIAGFSSRVCPPVPLHWANSTPMALIFARVSTMAGKPRICSCCWR